MKTPRTIMLALASLSIAVTASGCSVAASPPDLTGPDSAPASATPAAAASQAPTESSASPSSTETAIAVPTSKYQPHLNKTGPGDVGAATYLQTFFTESRTEMAVYNAPDKSLSDAESDKLTIAQFPVTLGFLDVDKMGTKKSLEVISDYVVISLFLEPSQFIYIDPAAVKIDGNTATIRTDAMKVVHKGTEEPLSESSDDTFTLTYDKDGHWKITGYTDS